VKTLERRLAMLEADSGSGRKDWAPILDALPTAELDRLGDMLKDREAGGWSSLSDLKGDDARLMGKIGVLSCED
jgi:hypothetical protein